MDKLERYIFENREQFDVYEPSDKVWQGIQQNTSLQRPVKKLWPKIMWRAAAVAAIFVFAFSLSEFIHRNKLEPIAQKQADLEGEIIIPELMEAEAYYTGIIQTKMTEVKKHPKIYPELENELNYDLVELDSVYAELKRDLKDNIATEEVIDAMIQNYRLKVEILEDILVQLKYANGKTEEEEQQGNQYEI